MEDLNKALKLVGEKPLQHSAIAKRIRENQSRWKQEEQRDRDFQNWLSDLLKSIRDDAEDASLVAALGRIASNPTVFG